jgi:hypothetical protein
MYASLVSPFSAGLDLQSISCPTPFHLCNFWDVGSKPVIRMDLRSLVELAYGSAGRVNMREELDRPRRPPTGGARGFSPLAVRPAMAVPPAKGLDEACAWLRKVALTPFFHRSLN